MTRAAWIFYVFNLACTAMYLYVIRIFTQDIISIKKWRSTLAIITVTRETAKVNV